MSNHATWSDSGKDYWPNPETNNTMQNTNKCKVPWCNRNATKTERCDIHAEIHQAYQNKAAIDAFRSFSERVLSTVTGTPNQ